MKTEIKSLLKNTAKAAVLTCVAAGAVAIVTSGTALKVIREGGKSLTSAAQKLLKKESAAETAEETVE